MRVHAVKSNTEPLSAQINELYLEAFPQNERKSIETLYSHQESGYCDLLAILEDDGQFVGMISTIKRPNIMLVEYFAIAPDFRGKGYGSKVLELLHAKYSDTHICLEIEDSTDESAENFQQRLSRLRFYQSNGFQQLHWVVNFFDVPLEVLGTSPDIDFDNYIQLYTQIHGEIIHKNIYLIDSRRGD